MAKDPRSPDIHPSASAARLRLPVEPPHLTLEVPQILRAAGGGPPVEWSVRVRNAAGELPRSGLRIAVFLGPGETGGSVRRLHWSILRQGHWSDLTGRTRVETDEFDLGPGRSRTVRIRLALPAGAGASSFDRVGAVLFAAVTAPWWPSVPEQPTGVTHNAPGTNVLVAH